MNIDINDLAALLRGDYSSIDGDTIAELLAALLALDEDALDEDVIDQLAAELAGSVELISTDESLDEYTGEPVYRKGRRELRAHGVTIAAWTRAAVGSYDGRHWVTTEDTIGGDGLPEIVEIVLDAMGLSDDLPEIPEPEEPSQSADGEYAVWWHTAGEGSGPQRERYATLREARRAVDAANRGLQASHGGHLLCGYSVAVFRDGEWAPAAAE
jgi:hypothetical protein